MHYFITKIPNKPELQQIEFDYSSDTDFTKNVLQNHISF